MILAAKFGHVPAHMETYHKDMLVVAMTFQASLGMPRDGQLELEVHLPTFTHAVMFMQPAQPTQLQAASVVPGPADVADTSPLALVHDSEVKLRPARDILPHLQGLQLGHATLT